MAPSRPATPISIALEEVEIVYPGGTAGLRRTTLRVQEGEITVLLGPSGAGKSTLLRCLNLLVSPSRGTVLATGLGPLRAAVLRDHRRRTGMVFQQHHLIGRLSALENVLVGRLGYHSALRTCLPLPRRDRLIALDALRRVGLLGKALTRADHLSGGEQQRVGFARALAQQPRLLLADEPVASLDPATATRLLADLRAICREDGITAVVSLHQVELALAFADRVIGLVAGRVVLDSAPHAIARRHLDELYADAGTAPMDQVPEGT